MALTEAKKGIFKEFANEFQPFEWKQPAKALYVFTDRKSGAEYCECHVLASKLVELATTDVPLDPDQPDYRANRELVTNHSAFAQMKEDASAGRSFSNIVAEYTKDYDATHPLKIIGGQHRFEAIKLALDAGVNDYHGVKVYLDLNMDQRLDVQLISNTNIAISSDLYDRMQETSKGPELREWCQSVGLLEQGRDFADRSGRGRPFSVQAARTFITNFYQGKLIEQKKFDVTDTTPTLCPSGEDDSAWSAIRNNSKVWTDATLVTAAKEFSALVKAQRAAFAGKSGVPVDYPEKTLNGAIMSAWAYVAGMLQPNNVRMQRHFALAKGYKKGHRYKQQVVALVEPKGRVRAFHVKAATADGVRTILVTNASRKSELHTDESKLYVSVGKEFAAHKTVEHGWNQGGFYVGKDGQTTNAVENFFGTFKRGMKGTYRFCSEQHLQRYVSEFEFRHNNRAGLGINDGVRTANAIRGIEGKRLTYRPINETQVEKAGS